MAATDSTSELQTSGGRPITSSSSFADDEYDSPILQAPAIAVLIIQNETDYRMMPMAGKPGIRGNAVFAPSDLADIEPSTSFRLVIVPKVQSERISYLIGQMGFLIVDRPLLVDCPTVGFEWTHFDDGEQEINMEVNDDGFEGTFERREEDGVPTYEFTVRKQE
ncbi:hypothetical protein TWF694_002727 [Orbilia ellipsospora]|uniref:Uncharacterized protein n=1 Tax=Orbilia ellipsospora TaxID=2528407 RepID=A0AAV9X2S9_9PEZI